MNKKIDFSLKKVNNNKKIIIFFYEGKIMSSLKGLFPFN